MGVVIPSKDNEILGEEEVEVSLEHVTNVEQLGIRLLIVHKLKMEVKEMRPKSIQPKMRINLQNFQSMERI